MSAKLWVFRLGLVEYEDGLALQHAFGEARAKDLIPDVLLLLQHPPVLTLGRAGKRDNIVAGQQQLDAVGAQIFETNRGGDVTYHGPGQLVGYPIVKLPEGRHDVRRYVRDLEESIIRTLFDFGVQAGRIGKWPGVWLGQDGAPDARKICAIGVHIARWQTSHGFALNVSTDLSHFNLIVPCGIKEAGVTTMSRELGRGVELSEVEQRFIARFSEVFDAKPEERQPEGHTVSVAVTRGEEVLLLKRTEERGGFWQLVTGRIEAGESAMGAAAREAREETGAKLAVTPLGYQHAFALGAATPPVVYEETAFAARWSGGDVQLDPREHVEHRWVKLPQAMELLPFAGLKSAARRALR